MNRDDILRMARKAATEDGSVNRDDGKDVVLYAAKTTRFLERFATLVEQDVMDSSMPAIKLVMRTERENGAREEREACADICDQHASVEGIAQRCADAIRARSRHEQG